MSQPDPSLERRIFEDLLDRDPSEREAWLESRCDGDPELHARLKRLLEAHEHAENLHTADAGGAGAVDSFPVEMRDPDRIGPYQVVECLGKGGMGAVYLAEQREPVRRQVALKVIKAGMDTQEVIARFHAERQALALMSHPNIARILDTAATEEGRPYFVMEYVPGIPILEYCDRTRRGIDQRLQLFMQVCSAVQHAHQKGVIHRDLKPSNILVTEEDGRPAAKVIDFGIAKAVGYKLSDMTIQTRLGQVIGTPEYMSPEQAGLDTVPIDPRTDVYSLGAVLYELISGAPPFEFRRRNLDLTDMQQIIKGEDPPPPSQRVRRTTSTAQTWSNRGSTSAHDLTRRLRRDLDWITMRALSKERSRRYATPADLAEDLRRHLAGEPVEAGPPTVAYRIGKFIRRHSGLVAASAVAVLALLAGGLLTTVGREWIGFVPGEVLEREARTLMILPMEVRGQSNQEEARYVGKAFSEALAISLARTSDLRVLPVPQKVDEGGALANASMALSNGAGRLVTGSLTRENDVITANLSLVSTRGSDVIWGTTAVSRESGMTGLADKMARELSSEMGIKEKKLWDDSIRSGRVETPEMAASPLLAEVISAFRRQDDEAMVSSTEKLLEAFPGDPDALTLRARALLLANFQADPASEIRRRIEDALGALKLAAPDSPWNEYLRIVVMNSDRNSHRKAIEMCEALLARDDLTTLARAQFLDSCSYPYREVAEVEKALEYMQEAVRLDPMYAKGLVGLGELLRQAGKPEEGLERIRQSVALNPGSYVARINLAWQYMFQDKEKEATEQAEKALALNGEDVQNNWAYGRIKYRFRKWGEAVAPLRKACKLSGSPEWCALAACALQRAGRDEEARAEAAKAESMPPSMNNYLYLGAYHAIAGNNAEAVRYIRRGVNMSEGFGPGFADAIKSYPDYENLDGDPAFDEVVEEVRRRATDK